MVQDLHTSDISCGKEVPTLAYNMVQFSKGRCMKKSNKKYLFIVDSKEFSGRRKPSLQLTPNLRQQTLHQLCGHPYTSSANSETNGWAVIIVPLSFQNNIFFFLHSSWFVMNVCFCLVQHMLVVVCLLVLPVQQGLNLTWKGLTAVSMGINPSDLPKSSHNSVVEYSSLC